MNRNAVTATQLSEALRTSAIAVNERASKESWTAIEQPRGAQERLYDVSRLPADVRAALAEKAFSAASAAMLPPEPAPLVGPGDVEKSAGALSSSQVGALAEWQIRVATARAAILMEADKLCQALGVQQGFEVFVQLAKEGSLAADVHELLRLANARRGADRALSVATLYEWRKLARGAATPAERLARLAPRMKRKCWAVLQGAEVTAALAKYRQPNKPRLRWCVAEVIGERGGRRFDSLYARCRRELAKIPAPVFYVGRHTGAALKALMPFRRRDSSLLAPNDIWIGDGHSAKLRIAHPETGNPFVPEVTVILDVATRFVVGWSVSLSENCLAVSAALRHAVSVNGLPLVYYSDGGAGQTAKMLDAPLTGILGSLGIHHDVGRPGNPQGRGVIERFWSTVLIPLAKRFDTYHGAGADRDTLRKVTLETDRTLRAATRAHDVTELPRRLPRFQEFVAALEDAMRAYNESHRHSSLPTFDGQHATPAQYRAMKLGDRMPDVPSPQELASLFMPSEVRKATRGEVRFFNGIYFHRDLMQVDDEDVRVCYDIHDVSYVLVRRLSGEFIARAELGGNRSGFMPKAFLERLRDERAARRLGLIEKKRAEILTERSAATLPAPRQRAPEEAAELRALEERYAIEQNAPLTIEKMDDWQRYKLWKDLRARKAAGEQLDARMVEFFNGFSDTGEIWLRAEQEHGGDVPA